MQTVTPCHVCAYVHVSVRACVYVHACVRTCLLACMVVEDIHV